MYACLLINSNGDGAVLSVTGLVLFGGNANECLDAVNAQEVLHDFIHGNARAAHQGEHDLLIEVSEVREKCNFLQELVDKKLMVGIWQVERQLPEAMSKFERLLGEHTERIAKAEEHEVRLNLALGRLSRNEERIQNCADRIERLPDIGRCQLTWREDMRKQLDDLDVHRLKHNVEMHSEALEDIRFRLQQVRDQVFHGPPFWQQQQQPMMSPVASEAGTRSHTPEGQRNRSMVAVRRQSSAPSDDTLLRAALPRANAGNESPHAAGVDGGFVGILNEELSLQASMKQAMRVAGNAPLRLRVSFACVSGLTGLSGGASSKFYCTCSVEHHRVTERETMCRTRGVNGPDPSWDETLEIEPWYGGEALAFAVHPDGNLRLRSDGHARLSSDRFIPGGFDGTLALSGLANAMLHVRVSLVGPATGDEAN
jgi:hypothetical protein